MKTAIHLSDLSLFGPSGRSVMAVIKGWFDDSQTTGEIWAVGGYLGNADNWKGFEAAWPLLMAHHEVPYFHMKEMANPNGVYKKWHPPQEHRDELAKYFGSMAAAIRLSGLTGFCSIVRLRDLEKFNSEHGLRLEPYPLAAYGCMLMIIDRFPTDPIELIFDHVEQVDSKLVKARQYAETFPDMEDVFGKMAMLPLAKDLTFREIPALQAADLFAWEFRKGHLGVNEWFEIPGKPETFEGRWKHFQDWSRGKFGNYKPPTRKSADALVEGQDFDYVVWDETNLRQAQELRRGVWS